MTPSNRRATLEMIRLPIPKGPPADKSHRKKFRQAQSTFLHGRLMGTPVPLTYPRHATRIQARRVTMVRTGRCQCGEIRFEVSGDPLRVGLCHCTDCRQTSGSAFTLFAIWSRRDFRTASHVATYRGR